MPCPVCGQEVPERFLNIHLDKCLQVQEQPSPVFTKKTKKKRAVSQAASNPFLLDSSQDEGGYPRTPPALSPVFGRVRDEDATKRCRVSGGGGPFSFHQAFL